MHLGRSSDGNFVLDFVIQVLRQSSDICLGLKVGEDIVGVGQESGCDVSRVASSDSGVCVPKVGVDWERDNGAKKGFFCAIHGV